jgi:hypothetical protein
MSLRKELEILLYAVYWSIKIKYSVAGFACESWAPVPHVQILLLYFMHVGPQAILGLCEEPTLNSW